jgi:hypothetical protein
MRRVEPGLVVIEPELGDPPLAGILERADVGRARLSIFVVGIDPDQRAGDVGADRDDRAALVGRQIDRLGLGVNDDRLVAAGPIDIIGDRVVRPVIFANDVDPVVDEPPRARRTAQLVDPAERVVGLMPSETAYCWTWKRRVAEAGRVFGRWRSPNAQRPRWSGAAAKLSAFSKLSP